MAAQDNRRRRESAVTKLVILGWGRSAVCPVGGALSGLHAHEIAAPVIRQMLDRAGIAASAVDALVAGNALGAGGNPARMAALAAGLPDRVAALSIDTQCCAGLDAVSMAAGMLFAGSAGLVSAGGVEAWSRAPLRQHRPLTATQAPVSYERPSFAPDPARDPDLLQAAAAHALSAGLRRERQDAHAMDSHQRAVAARAQLSDEITPVGLAIHDSHVRTLSVEKIRRLPVVAMTGHDASSAEQASLAAAHAVSMLAVSPRADGAAFVVLASEEAASSLDVKPQFRWHTGVSIGSAPERPMLATITATELALQRCGLEMKALWGVELHDAFAAQALAFLDHFSLDPARLNRRGGGLARGHPIGASGAISLVRLLSDMARDAPAGAFGATTIAGAGGLGAAAIVERL